MHVFRASKGSVKSFVNWSETKKPGFFFCQKLYPSQGGRPSHLTKGNLSSHLSKLEQAGYVAIEKTYRGKLPLTLCRLTKSGRKAFEEYRNQLDRFLKSTE